MLISISKSLTDRDSKGASCTCRTAGKLAGTGALLPTMMAAIPQWFAASRHSCFLYLASELVKVFGDVPRYEGALGELALCHQGFINAIFTIN